MATEADKYEGFRQKLENTCEENGLLYQFSTAGYPITLTIRPQQGLDAQLSFLQNADRKAVNNTDSTIQFFMNDGELTIKTYERFTITWVLLNKIKNLFIKMHSAYVQMFNRDVTQNNLLRSPYAPASATDNEKFTEPLEEYEEEAPGAGGDAEEFPEDLFGGDPEEQPEEKGVSRDDWLLKTATAHVRKIGKCVLHDLMEEFTIGYSEAARLIEALEDAGVVGDPAPGGGRVVLDIPD